MNLEQLRTFCLSLPGATEDVKWGNDLCFSVGGKMFCVTGLEAGSGVSLKVGDERFIELCETESIEPAPYVGRYKWILIRDPHRFCDDEWRDVIRNSYVLIASKLPKKLRPSELL